MKLVYRNQQKYIGQCKNKYENTMKYTSSPCMCWLEKLVHSLDIKL